jgi:phage terminase large subunit GpA-like protein
MRLDRTPYVRGILDAAADPVVEEIVWVKCTQIGGSETGRNLLGYWIDVDPGPCLVVMPDEKSARDTIDERIRPMMESSPRLRRHVSAKAWDNKLDKIRLDTMEVYVGWAGSAQSLASRPCRFVFFDETDKYPPFAGREADPISLGTERTKTYGHRKKIVKTSTPTTRDGAIWKAWEGCGDQRRYHVPCPHCGTFQALTWPQVKWPKNLAEPDKVKLADQIELNRLAWYECANPDCRGRIDDRHKPKMLAAGRWVGNGLASKRVGFHINAIYSPWLTFAAVAAQFIRAEGDVAATMNFRNSWLAEPFEVQVSKREPSKIRDKAAAAEKLGPAGKARVVPNWAVLLIATADVQKDHCYYSVTAWGYELQSKRVAVGVATTFDELYRRVFAPDVPFAAEQGGVVHVQTLIVDSGYRKDEVTEFARRDPARVQLAKGLSTYFGAIAELKVEKASGVTVWNINTMQSKDTLDRLIGDPDADKWQVYPDVGDEFCAQMTSEHKVLNPQTKRAEWKEKSSGAANHYWDCEAMACAVASAMGAGIAKPVEARTESPRSSADDARSNPMNYRGRW